MLRWSRHQRGAQDTLQLSARDDDDCRPPQHLLAVLKPGPPLPVALSNHITGSLEECATHAFSEQPGPGNIKQHSRKNTTRGMLQVHNRVTWCMCFMYIISMVHNTA